MIRLRKQPKILETKKEIINLVRNNAKPFNLTITARKKCYLKGNFTVNGIEYYFYLQYYVRYFPRVHFIDIENRKLDRMYKHLYRSELKELLTQIKSITE